MHETTLSADRYNTPALSVSLGLKVLLVPGLTVSLGLPYRGRDRETETGERPGLLGPSVRPGGPPPFSRRWGGDRPGKSLGLVGGDRRGSRARAGAGSRGLSRE
jgi:hypothetical protein